MAPPDGLADLPAGNPARLEILQKYLLNINPCIGWPRPPLTDEALRPSYEKAALILRCQALLTEPCYKSVRGESPVLLGIPVAPTVDRYAPKVHRLGALYRMAY